MIITAEWEIAIDELPASPNGLATFVDNLAAEPLGPMLIALARAGQWSELLGAVDETARPAFRYARLAQARATELLDGKKPSIEASGYVESAGRRATDVLDDIIALSSVPSPDAEKIVSMIDGNDRRLLALTMDVRRKLTDVHKKLKVRR